MCVELFRTPSCWGKSDYDYLDFEQWKVNLVATQFISQPSQFEFSTLNYCWVTVGDWRWYVYNKCMLILRENYVHDEKRTEIIVVGTPWCFFLSIVGATSPRFYAFPFTMTLPTARIPGNIEGMFPARIDDGAWGVLALTSQNIGGGYPMWPFVCM